LKRQMEEIAKAKDAKAVAAIRKKYSSEWEQFDTLLAACRKALAVLPRVIQEALFYWTRGDAFAPDYMEWNDAVRKALENDALTEDPNEEHQYWPNKERPKINQAMKDINALQRFLEQECSAREIATDADLRLCAPKECVGGQPAVCVARASRQRDPRVPVPGKHFWPKNAAEPERGAISDYVLARAHQRVRVVRPTETSCIP